MNQTCRGNRKPATQACLALCLVFLGNLHAQDIPLSSAKPWHSDREAQFARQLQILPDRGYALDANHHYIVG
jgi:hypothetical protein